MTAVRARSEKGRNGKGRVEGKAEGQEGNETCGIWWHAGTPNQTGNKRNNIPLSSTSTPSRFVCFQLKQMIHSDSKTPRRASYVGPTLKLKKKAGGG